MQRRLLLAASPQASCSSRALPRRARASAWASATSKPQCSISRRSNARSSTACGSSSRETRDDDGRRLAARAFVQRPRRDGFSVLLHVSSDDLRETRSRRTRRGNRASRMAPSGSRCATTASGAPGPTGAAFSAWRTASPSSTAGCGSRARPTAARSSPQTSPTSSRSPVVDRCSVEAEGAARREPTALSQRTAMKEGLLSGTLSVSSRSELEKANAHVARWIGSEWSSARYLLGR
jgi:hypothetical protein